jgi:hypothetical protein
MHELSTVNPLMQPVLWQGKPYYTSNYHHVMYRRNAQERGQECKHERHGNFLQAVRAWPSYDLYVERKDIVVLQWSAVKSLKSELTEEISSWHTLFKANGWNELTLLNEVAQIELYHHLDDPLSQEISYRHSQQGAQRVEADPLERMARVCESMDNLARAISVKTDTLAAKHEHMSQRIEAGFEEHSAVLSDVQDKVQEIEADVDHLKEVITPEHLHDIVNDIVAAELHRQRPPLRALPRRSQEGPSPQQAFRVPPTDDVGLPPPGTETIWEYFGKHRDTLLFTVVTKAEQAKFHFFCQKHEKPFKWLPPGYEFPRCFYMTATIHKACIEYERWIRNGRVETPLRYEPRTQTG